MHFCLPNQKTKAEPELANVQQINLTAFFFQCRKR